MENVENFFKKLVAFATPVENFVENYLYCGKLCGKLPFFVPIVENSVENSSCCGKLCGKPEILWKTSYKINFKKLLNKFKKPLDNYPHI